MPNIGAIIPIRLASERLPNKALRPICGRPVVHHLLDRVCASRHLSDGTKAVVCTTKETSDDPLVDAVRAYGASVFRGSTDDIIQRFHDAIEAFGFDAVIQADGDDPLTDTAYMDLTMDRLLGDPALGIVTCEGLPLGVASKSFRRAAMRTVHAHYKSVQNDTGFIYFFTKTGLCTTATVAVTSPRHVHQEARLTLDYEEDLRLFTAIFEALYREGEIFGLEAVVDLLRARPELLRINGNLDEAYWQRTRDKARLEYRDGDGRIRIVPV